MLMSCVCLLSSSKPVNPRLVASHSKKKIDKARSMDDMTHSCIARLTGLIMTDYHSQAQTDDANSTSAFALQRDFVLRLKIVD